MKQRITIIILSCVFFLFGLVNPLSANDNDIEEKLLTLNQQDDKQHVVSTLSQWLNLNQFSTLDKIKISIQLSKTLFALHQYHNAIAVCTEARILAESENAVSQLAQANKMLGVLYYYQGELQPALDAYEASLVYFVENQHADAKSFAIERANLLNNIALVYTALGQPELSLATYKLAESLYAKEGDEIDKNDVRHNIATLHISLKRYDIAIDILKGVIAKRKEFDDQHGVATASAALGIAYKDSGQLKLGELNILSALAYFKKHNFKHDIASQLHNLSELYNDMFDVDKATYYGKKALAVSEKIGHQKAFAGSLQSLAKTAFYSGDLPQAQQYISRSTQVGIEKDYQTLLTENLAITALIHAASEQYNQSLSLLQQYEKKYQLAENNRLNDKLAEFESTQLNQQITVLKNREKVQELETIKTKHQRNIIILTLILVLVIIFFGYRRNLELRITHELELRVKQRTRELEKLTKEVAKANQVKSQFLANMSHEIRTPLTAIVGHADVISEPDYDHIHIQEDISVIQGNSLHLLDLINNILDLSRIEANKFELEVQPTNLQALIQDLSDTFKAQALHKNLPFTIEHDLPSPCVVNIDNLRLKQILINLCANAVKFTEQGRVTLSVTYTDDELSFTVTDTGIGLSALQLTQIFETFTQADNSISRRFGGSGLGLSLSYQLARLMSGDIKVTSELGHGSRFCLTLPCNQEPSDKLPSNVVAYVEQENTMFSGKVLLAEDHKDNQKLIARLLRKLGLEVIIANNGKEAIELCMVHKPDLILLDIQMPEIDGVEAFKTLREYDYNQPIYALTANAMSHEIKEYLTLGFTGHLKKPIERTHFVATISKYFVKGDESIPFNEQVQQAQSSLDEIDLKDLSEDFVQGLIAEKTALVKSFTDNDLNEMKKIVHRISGAAQMFGYNEISQAAQVLESLLKKEQDPLSNEETTNAAMIDDLLHCLLDEISLTQSSHSAS